MENLTQAGLYLLQLIFIAYLFGFKQPYRIACCIVKSMLKYTYFLIINIFSSMFSLFAPTHSGENAQFAGFWDKLKIMRSRNAGLLVGSNRLSLEASFAHMILMAPTGTGKTTRFVIPNVMSLDHSMVITDPSGEIFERTSGYLASKGFRIKVLQPTDLRKPLKIQFLSFDY